MKFRNKYILVISKDLFEKTKKRLENICNTLGVFSLVIMMIAIVIDVFFRFVLSSPIKGAIDIVSLMLVNVFFAGYASVEANDNHIKINVLTRKLPDKFRSILLVNGDLFTLIIAIIICNEFAKYTFFLYKNNVFASVLEVPLWIFIAPTVAFMVIFIFMLLMNSIKRLTLLLRDGYQILIGLLPGYFLVIALYLFTFFPNLIPNEISRNAWGIMLLILLFLLMFLEVRVFSIMAFIALLGLSYLTTLSGSLNNLALSAFAVSTDYTWSVAPLFMWMGFLVLYGGFAKELYNMAYSWIGHIAGGLNSATAFACTGLGAVTGNSMSGVISMGQIALPEMRKYKYDIGLSAASICAAAAICSLIPPSFGFIIYGMLANVSIAKLFIAGIIPGILFMFILILVNTVICTMNPKMGPPGPKFSWKERIKYTKEIWPIVVLFLTIIISIYAGIGTPNEAAALGAFGAIVISIFRKRLTFAKFFSSAVNAVTMMATIFSIFIFATALGNFLATTRLPSNMGNFIISLNLSPFLLICIILLIYIFLGCVMNFIPALIITLPIILPVITKAGFDLVWFGVLIVIMLELAQITPPIGMNIFVVSTIATDVPLYTIFKRAFPFWIAFIILTIIIVAFPKISLFLPNMMK